MVKTPNCFWYTLKSGGKKKYNTGDVLDSAGWSLQVVERMPEDGVTLSKKMTLLRYFTSMLLGLDEVVADA